MAVDKKQYDELFEKIKTVTSNALDDIKTGLIEVSEKLEETRKLWVKDAEETPTPKTRKSTPAAKKKTAKEK